MRSNDAPAEATETLAQDCEIEDRIRAKEEKLDEHATEIIQALAQRYYEKRKQTGRQDGHSEAELRELRVQEHGGRRTFVTTNAGYRLELHPPREWLDDFLAGGSDLKLAEALEKLRPLSATRVEIKAFVDFIASSTRSIVR